MKLKLHFSILHPLLSETLELVDSGEPRHTKVPKPRRIASNQTREPPTIKGKTNPKSDLSREKANWEEREDWGSEHVAASSFTRKKNPHPHTASSETEAPARAGLAGGAPGVRGLRARERAAAAAAGAFMGESGGGERAHGVGAGRRREKRRWVDRNPRKGRWDKAMRGREAVDPWNAVALREGDTPSVAKRRAFVRMRVGGKVCSRASFFKCRERGERKWAVLKWRIWREREREREQKRDLGKFGGERKRERKTEWEWSDRETGRETASRKLDGPFPINSQENTWKLFHKVFSFSPTDTHKKKTVLQVFS